MNRRDVIFDLVDSGRLPEGYVPAAFFLHFGADFRFGPAAVEKHKEYFRATDMDFVKIQYERNFPKQTIEALSDWDKFVAPDREFYAPMVEVVSSLVHELKDEAPIIVTLYSPFMCLGDVATKPKLVEHILEDADAVTPAFETATESLLLFVDACIKAGVDGFYHSTQGGETNRFPDPIYFEKYIKPWDLVVMNEIAKRCCFSILHVCDYHKADCGGYADLTPYVEYPGQMVNCNPDIGGKTLTGQQISNIFGRPYMGGLDRMGVLSTGSPDEVRDEVRRVLHRAEGPFILGADCTVPGATPWANLRAAVDTAHGR